MDPPCRSPQRCPAEPRAVLGKPRSALSRGRQPLAAPARLPLSSASCFALVETPPEVSGGCVFPESQVRGPWWRFQLKGICPLGSAGTNQCAPKAGASGTGISPGRTPSCPPTYDPRPIRTWKEAEETQKRIRSRRGAKARVISPRSEAVSHFVEERREPGLRAVARDGLREKCHLICGMLGGSTAGKLLIFNPRPPKAPSPLFFLH